jgi:hypothetical protein
LIPESDKRKLEALATDILNLDPRIYSCAIVSNPQGSVIARAVRAEFQITLGSLVQETDGMAGHWAIRAFSAMERLNATRSKVKYIVVGREKNKALIFHFDVLDNLLIIMSIYLNAESTELFETVTKFVESSNLMLTAGTPHKID